MTITYAFRVIFYLGQKGDGCTAKVLASEMAIPQKYLIKVLTRLRTGGLVSSLTGPAGGYKLCKDLSDIRVIDVMTVMQSNTRSDRCLDDGQLGEGHKSDMNFMWNYYYDMRKQVREQWLSMSLRQIMETYGEESA